MTVAAARALRRLYDLEAAAFAAAVVLLGRPDPDRLAAANPTVAGDTRRVTTRQGRRLVVSEHAWALLRGWAGQRLWPRDWADDVAATYLTLRLEIAQRHSGVVLLDPQLPMLPSMAWHRRYDPGAAQLAWITRSSARVT